ncbi:MAG: AAA family ATPase, partial [Lachnospiraceae bacterium]|nr:AAA family ATPase [Lachnospiraceae bacterium]
MGYYLNSARAFTLYQNETNNPYYVDKTMLLAELIPLVKSGNKHICITRPRRFGKSVMASMIAAFFSKGTDASRVFDSLKIAQCPSYLEYMNRQNVIFINFSEAANLSKDYDVFINRIERTLKRDLQNAFPDVNFWEDSSPVEDLRLIHEETGASFLFVLDEWDCIFHKKYITKDDQESFISFLAALTKDTGYISLTYMTGVLPIAKYSSGSTINHFMEYT